MCYIIIHVIIAYRGKLALRLYMNRCFSFQQHLHCRYGNSQIHVHGFFVFAREFDDRVELLIYLYLYIFLPLTLACLICSFLRKVVLTTVVNFISKKRTTCFITRAGGQFVHMLFFVFLQITKERKDKVMINFADERELKKC